MPARPTADLATITSLIPLSAPMVMAVRIATESVPGWQIASSLLLSVAAVVALIALAARVYSGALLRLGGRTGLLAASRGGAA